jgi:hypothetical protein
MSDADKFSGLKFLIQYRRRDDGVRWHNMAAFDVMGPAEKYFAQQRRDEDWPWEYQMVDLETGLCTHQSPQESE